MKTHRLSIITILLLMPLFFSSCDSKIANNLEGYWQSSSEIVKFERQGEIGGISDDNKTWYVKFGYLHWRNKVYDMKWDNDKITLKADGDFKIYHKISEQQATKGRKFAETVVSFATDENTYMGVTSNTLRSQLGYNNRDFNLVSENTYAVYYSEAEDCGDNIFNTGQIFKVNRRSTKVQVFVQNFRMGKGTSPQRVATLIKERLEKKFHFTMYSGKLSMDVGSDQFEQQAFWYINMSGGNSFAILYDESMLDFVVGFDNAATATFLNMDWGD